MTKGFVVPAGGASAYALTSGAIAITKNLTIEGAGAASTVVSGMGGDNNLFEIATEERPMTLSDALTSGYLTFNQLTSSPTEH